MMRSMYAGVSGLRNHQVRMDVIGNNIANVNTIGFKSGRVTFQDTLNQILRGAAAPQGTRGGINPIQIGLGVNIASIDVIHTQGNLQNTGKISDVAIQGDGFFILSDGGNQYYTRAGGFNLERDGRLVNPSNGLIVQGWMADQAGDINPNGPLTNIQLPIGQTINPIATTTIQFAGNLDSTTFGELRYTEQTLTDADGNSVRVSFTLTPTSNYNEFTYTATVSNGTIVSGTGTGTISINLDGTVNVVTGGDFQVQSGAVPSTPITITPPVSGQADGGYFSANTTPATNMDGIVTIPKPIVNTTRIYDSLGNAHTVVTTVTKTDVNNWSWVATDAAGNNIGSGSLSFDTSGNLIASPGSTISFTPTGANTVVITPDFSDITQFASNSSEINSPYQDGYPMGQLQSFNIDSAGRVIGIFSNGMNKALAQLAIANFTNPAGLLRAGDTMFQASGNSGPAQVGQAGQSGRGLVTPGAVEMSNVDLSQEFTDMIVTQRGFQSNSRIITTSDEMLQELVNLKR